MHSIFLNGLYPDNSYNGHNFDLVVLGEKDSIFWYCLLYCIISGYLEHGCVDRINNGSDTKFDISCKEDRARISFIDVTSGRGLCSDRLDCCVGKTPQLIVSHLNCYWKRSCSINFPTEIIIMPTQISPGCNCIRYPPDYLELKEVMCFTPKDKPGKFLNPFMPSVA